MSLLTSLSESQAKAWLAASELLLLAASVVLVAGWVGEWLMPEAWKKLVWYRLAKACIILGVVGELFGVAGIFEASARLVSVLETDNIRLQLLANGARDRAAKSELTLEQFKSPRTLKPEQQDRIVAALKPFAGMRFDFTIQPGPEPEALMGQIAEILARAGWVWQPKQNAGAIAFLIAGKPQSGVNTSFVGLGAEIDSSKAREWRPALVALTEAFAAEALPMRANIAADGSALPDGIHIFVGGKP